MSMAIQQQSTVDEVEDSLAIPSLSEEDGEFKKPRKTRSTKKARPAARNVPLQGRVAKKPRVAKNPRGPQKNPRTRTHDKVSEARLFRTLDILVQRVREGHTNALSKSEYWQGVAQVPVHEVVDDETFKRRLRKLVELEPHNHPDSDLRKKMAIIGLPVNPSTKKQK